MREFSRPKSCVFCNINNKDFKIVYQDTEFYGFHDRRPDAKAHILVIPKNHLGTVPELKPEDKPTVEKMYKIGQEIMKKEGFSQNDCRFGFHRPPFNTIHHLHLHCIGLPFSSWLAAKMYPQGKTRWFMPVGDLIQRLGTSSSLPSS